MSLLAQVIIRRGLAFVPFNPARQGSDRNLLSLVEAWAWERAEEQVCDRSVCPWDSEPRRPSHNDKRKALQREVLHGEIQEALSGWPSRERMRALAERLLTLAA